MNILIQRRPSSTATLVHCLCLWAFSAVFAATHVLSSLQEFDLSLHFLKVFDFFSFSGQILCQRTCISRSSGPFQLILALLWRWRSVNQQLDRSLKAQDSESMTVQ